jgi:hypothetical protein
MVMIDESDNDIERVLAAAIPRQAPTGLRSVILAAVAAELDEQRAKPNSGWQSWIGRAVAATLLFSIVTFAGVGWFESRRMAAWDERPVVRSDVAEVTAAVASVTDESSAQGVERYLLSRLHNGIRPSSDAMRHDVKEIERWAEGGPLAERIQSDETIKDRI